MIKELAGMLINKLMKQLLFVLFICLLCITEPKLLLLSFLFVIIYGLTYTLPRIRYIKTQSHYAVDTFISKNPETTVEIMENDFRQSLFKNSTTVIGQLYTFFASNGTIHIFENKQLSKISYSTSYRRSQLTWYLSNSSEYQIHSTELEIKQILLFYQKSQPDLMTKK